MTQDEIKHVQERIGTEVDGFWGPMSTEAAKRHLKKLMPDSGFPTQRKVRKDSSVFGRHGEPDGSYQPPTKKFRLPFKLHLYGKEGDTVSHLSCHALCAEALEAVFHRLAEIYPDKAARKAAWGISTLPTWRMRFLPAFCLSKSLRLRDTSPP